MIIIDLLITYKIYQVTLVILSNTDMLISGTRQFSCRKQFPFVLFTYQCLYLGPTYSCEKVAFVCTTIILYSMPNWYALMKSCINVNHFVLLVRSRLKYVWFTKFTKFWGEVKNGPSLGISNSKKVSASGALVARDPPSRAPGPCWGLRPRPPSVSPAPNLPLHHWLCGTNNDVFLTAFTYGFCNILPSIHWTDK